MPRTPTVSAHRLERMADVAAVCLGAAAGPRRQRRGESAGFARWWGTVPDRQGTAAGDLRGRTRRIVPLHAQPGPAEPVLAAGPPGERWRAAPLLGDHIAPALALLLILGGTLVSVAVAAFLLARVDLATALGSWLEAPPFEMGPKMQAQTRADVDVQETAPAAGAAPEFGFVEGSRLPHRNAPRPPAGAAQNTAAMVASRSGPATGFPSGPARDAGAPGESAHAAETAAPPHASADAEEARAKSVTEPAAMPAEAALPAAERVAEGKGKAACLPPIVLGFPRNSLTPAEGDLGTEAAELSAWLSRLPQASVVIEGHTDSLGPDDVNRAVSEQRARAIAGLLIRRGLPAERIFVRGMGESRLLPAFGPAAAQQRRVVLRLDGIAGCGAETVRDPAP